MSNVGKMVYDAVRRSMQARDGGPGSGPQPGGGGGPKKEDFHIKPVATNPPSAMVALHHKEKGYLGAHMNEKGAQRRIDRIVKKGSTDF